MEEIGVLRDKACATKRKTQKYVKQLNGQTGTYQKTEGIQNYLRTWGRYDPIEPGLFEAKKVGYMGVA